MFDFQVCNSASGCLQPRQLVVNLAQGLGLRALALAHFRTQGLGMTVVQGILKGPRPICIPPTRGSGAQ